MRGEHSWRAELGCLAVVLVALTASFSRADAGAGDADGAVLIRTPVSARITSGKVLSGRWSSERAAEELAKLLGSNTLGVPCGLIGE